MSRNWIIARLHKVLKGPKHLIFLLFHLWMLPLYTQYHDHMPRSRLEEGQRDEHGSSLWNKILLISLELELRHKAITSCNREHECNFYSGYSGPRQKIGNSMTLEEKGNEYWGITSGLCHAPGVLVFLIQDLSPGDTEDDLELFLLLIISNFNIWICFIKI